MDLLLAARMIRAHTAVLRLIVSRAAQDAEATPSPPEGGRAARDTWRTHIRATNRRRRIFLGPVEIAGYYTSLAAGLTALGMHAEAIDLGANPYAYAGPGQRLPRLVRLAQRLRAARQAPAGRRLPSAAWRGADAAVSILTLVWAVVRFDVFVFSFGMSIFGLRELPLLRRLGKRIVFVFHGSDARAPFIDGALLAPGRRPAVEGVIAQTKLRKSRLSRIERHAHAVIAQPAFSHLFSRPVVDWFVVGMPWRAAPTAAADPIPRGTAIRILHSPSDPVVKGTGRIRAVVEDLVREGLPLELVELQGVPNEVVRREIAGCDFVIDQIYSDAPMVAFATEAAAAAKPAIVGGYAWPENHRILRGPVMPPVEECTPEALPAAIRHLALDPAHRERLGARAQAFVAGWAAEEVARRLLLVIEGETPAGWWFDPAELRYVEGCGLTREAARQSVAAVLQAGGRTALCLDDKPELEQCFVDFAEGRA